MDRNTVRVAMIKHIIYVSDGSNAVLLQWTILGRNPHISKSESLAICQVSLNEVSKV